MLDKLTQLAGLMRNLPRIKEEMDRFQTTLGQLTADGDAGGGMVKVRVNGRLEVTSCKLSDEAMALQDREMLEDLIRSAANQALEKARRLVAEEASKMGAGLGLPAGMTLPLPGMGAE